MATATTEWMTREELEAKYRGCWIRGVRLPVTIDTLDAQLEKGKHSGKAIVFALTTDVIHEKKLLRDVTVMLRTFAARRKNGEWLFSEDDEDKDFVMAELTGLSVSEYHKCRDEYVQRMSESVFRV